METLVAVGLLLLALLGGEALLGVYRTGGVLLFSSLFWLLVSLGVLVLARRG